MNDELHQIERLARCLAETLRILRQPSLETDWIQFPKNSCAVASSLFLVILDDYGITGFRIYQGIVPDSFEEKPHQWVQRGEIVVDITASQFDGHNQPEIVCGPSKWHKTLSGSPNADLTLSTEREYNLNNPTDRDGGLLHRVKRLWPIPYPL